MKNMFFRSLKAFIQLPVGIFKIIASEMTFDNIGGKIKGLAKFIFFCGTLVSIIYALILFSQNGRIHTYVRGEYVPRGTIGTGLLFLVCGPVVSWISCFAIYGFGELIEKVTNINNELAKISNQVTDSDENINDSETRIEPLDYETKKS